MLAPDALADPQDLPATLAALLAGETDPIANAANTAALIAHTLPDLNWAGFYFLRPDAQGGQELVLGPFWGRPACVRIPLGRGVCGTAAAERRSVLVADVHDFPGHIACDAASRSELVVPVMNGQALLGVIDLDSPTQGRFGAAEQRIIEAAAAIYAESLSAAAPVR